MQPNKAPFATDSAFRRIPLVAFHNGYPAARNAIYQSPFQSFWMGGFEASTHCRRDGRRIDVIAATQHDRFAHQDYARMRRLGLSTARDGVRWHLIEQTPGRYDWSSACPQIRAAQAENVQIIWDLLHYGWPDDLDIFSADFVKRFAKFARAFARLITDEGIDKPLICPVNEISFFSWAGGDVAYMNPFACERGHELKRQLVRAGIEAMNEIWSVAPGARFVHTDPVINIVPDPQRPEDARSAEAQRTAQFEGWDMISGRLHPELGGAPEYLDILGINYYIHNQRIYPGGHGTMIEPSHPLHRPLRDMLREVFDRYHRPLFIAETGIEDEARSMWLRYVATEALATREMGVPLHGLCLYPIVNHPGWDDDRHCHNALWDYADENGNRLSYEPLEEELRRQMRLMKSSKEDWQRSNKVDATLLDRAAHHMQATEPDIDDSCELSGVGSATEYASEQ